MTPSRRLCRKHPEIAVDRHMIRFAVRPTSGMPTMMRPRLNPPVRRFEEPVSGGVLVRWKDAAWSGPIGGVPPWEAAQYAHPRDVLLDTRLDKTRKRVLLASWASDACAVESRPAFRWLPGTPGPVALDRILAAIRSLDEEYPAQGGMVADSLH
jgi:hypothetical protein